MQKQSFIFDFMFSPRFRFWRHLLLILTFAIMSINQGLADYRDVLPALGNKIYLIVAVIFLNYIGVGYLIIFVLAPKLLLKGKYVHFVLCIMFAAMAFLIVPNILAANYLDNYELFSAIAILDNISAYLIYILAISGVTVPVFLKNWMSENKRVSQLEKNRVSSEVEQLKEQINPESFFNILNQTGRLVKTEPDRASAMLMKLSQLLRYQLYDCNRSQVLLIAEINFIRNFLEMERLYAPHFNYTIEMTGDLHTKFIPPSVLLPYVQGAMKAFNDTNEHKKLAIHINNNDQGTYFVLKMSGGYNKKLLEKELIRLKERLRLLFDENYLLMVTENEDASEIVEMSLTLYNN